MLGGIRVVEAAGDDDFAVNYHDLVVHQAGRLVDQHGNSGGAEVLDGERVVVVAAVGELFVVNDGAHVDAVTMRIDESRHQRPGRNLISLNKDRFSRSANRGLD